MTAKPAIPSSPISPTASWIDVIVVAAAQWPMAAVAVDWILSPPNYQATAADIWTVGLSVAATAGWLVTIRRLGNFIILRCASAVCLMLASAISFREAPIELTLIFMVLAGVASAFAAWAGRRKRLCLVLCNGVGIAVLLLGVEAATDPRTGMGIRIDDQRSAAELYINDASTMWRLQPDSVTHHRIILDGQETLFDVTYHIQPDGGRRVPLRPDHGSRWCILGASFAFGQGLTDDQTFANRIQALIPSVRVENFAVPSLGTSDAHFILRERLERAPDTSRVIYFMIDDHFRRVDPPWSNTALDWWTAQRPFFELRNGQLIYLGKRGDYLSLFERAQIHLSKRTFLYNLWARWHLAQWRPTRASQQITAALIRDMAEACRKIPNCKFSVIRLPEKNFTEQDPPFMAKWQDGLRLDGVEVLDFVPVLRDHAQTSGQPVDHYFYPVDYHPRTTYIDLLMAWITPHTKRWADQAATEISDPT